MSDFNLDFVQQLKENQLVNVGGGYTGPVQTYIIQQGDCLSVLAERFHTTVKTLCELNHISNPDLIYTGHKLLVPAYEIVYVT